MRLYWPPRSDKGTIHSIALLLGLRGVDAVEPDLGLVDVDGVAVYNAGLAGDICMGGER